MSYNQQNYHMNNSPSVGDIIEIRVMNINPELGIFARMPNGVDGLIRLKDIGSIYILLLHNSLCVKR